MERSLVSFWQDEACTQFVGSGFWAEPHAIITAAHLFDDGAQWVKAHDGKAFQVMEYQLEPNNHDIAVVRVSTESSYPSLRPIRLPDPQGQRVYLNGFFEGVREAPLSFTITKWDDETRLFVMAPKQPKGHSGSALCFSGRVWGIAIGHYSDPSTDRGCGLALSQVWPWLEQVLPDFSAFNGPSRDELIEDVQAHLKEAFDLPFFRKLRERRDFLQKILSGCQKFERDAYLYAVNCLITALKDAAKTLKDPDFPHSALYDKKEIAYAWKSALAGVARLSMAPGAFAEGSELFASWEPALREVKARTPGSAPLVVGLNRSDCWRFDPQVNTLCDRYVHELDGLESGQGQDIQRSLRSVVTSMSAPVGGNASDEEFELSAAFLKSEGMEGRGRVLTLHAEHEVENLRTWVEQELGVMVLLRQPPRAGGKSEVFLCDESLLLARMREFLNLLTDPIWTIP